MKHTGAITVLVLAVAACMDDTTPVNPSRLAPLVIPQGDLRTQLMPGEYIVVLNDDARDVMGSAAASGAEVLATWDVALNGYAVRASAEQLRTIRSDPRVKFVEPNGIMSTTAIQAPTPSWGLDRIDQGNLPLDNSYSHYPTAGSGVHAYIIDSGINHLHFEWGDKNARRLGNHADFITPGGTAADCNGHGTHVAGTLGGSTYGVARGVTIHAVRVLGCDGRGPISGVISGINWVAANRILPAVANLSLGGAFSPSSNAATTALVNSGVFTAVASGNDGLDACNYSPASTPSATTVNSSTSWDARTSTSNFGTCTDIFAPGNSITSAYIGSMTASATMGGTSMAAPHVAGAAAVYIDLFRGKLGSPLPTPRQVDSVLKARATLNAISNPGTGSPNRLLNINFLAPPVAAFTVGCASTSGCTADASSSTDNDGLSNLSFAWTNSVGRPIQTSAVASYAYDATDLTRNTFTLTLTVSDSDGLRNYVTQVVTVPAPPSNQAPVADFTITCVTGVSCTVNAATSTDDGGTGNLSFAWTNAVGRPAKAGPVATYLWSTPGGYPNTFDVTLSATDAGGMSHSITRHITIPPKIVNQPPVAVVTMACQSAVKPHSCVLDATRSSDDGGSSNLSFTWANNVGRPAKTGGTATYVYAAQNLPNSFDVTLTVTDAAGLTGNATVRVVIP